MEKGAMGGAKLGSVTAGIALCALTFNASCTVARVMTLFGSSRIMAFLQQ